MILCELWIQYAVMNTDKRLSVVLHNIRSVHNVGSIFRTADAAGVSKIYVTGFTPAPIDRFGRIRKDFAKVSLGAEQSVPWEYRKNITSLLRELREQKTRVIAVEQDEHSTDYRKLKRKGSVALVFGNEVSGIPKRILSLCDTIVEIPMRGTKESLNVSVAVGIVLFNSCRNG